MTSRISYKALALQERTDKKERSRHRRELFCLPEYQTLGFKSDLGHHNSFRLDDEIRPSKVG